MKLYWIDELSNISPGVHKTLPCGDADGKNNS